MGLHYFQNVLRLICTAFKSIYRLFFSQSITVDKGLKHIMAVHIANRLYDPLVLRYYGGITGTGDALFFNTIL